MIDIYRSFIKEVKSGDIKKLYLLYGQENYLLDKGLEEIKDRVVTGLEEINYMVFDNKNIDIDELQIACETLPFGSEKKLIVVKDFSGLRTKSKKIEGEKEEKEENLGAEIISLINNLVEDTCLVFFSRGDVDKRKKLYKDINKIGSVFEFKRIDKADLRQWITRFFKNEGKIFGGEVLEYFMQNISYLGKGSDSNMYNIQNEMEKILAYTGEEKEISMNSIKALINEPPENDVFKLIDACLEGDIPSSLIIYSDLLLRGESTYSILGLISWGIKNIIKIKELQEEGLNIKGISSRLKMNEFIVRKNINKCNKVSFKTLEGALGKCIKCETDLKTGKFTEKPMERLALEVLLTELFK